MLPTRRMAHPFGVPLSRPRPLIAVVDDEEPVRKALRRLIVAAGNDCETFASGADFLASLEDHEPDCLLLDLHMPGLTGLDVQACLARVEPRIPIVIITGQDQPEMRRRALAAGAAAYLLKPVDEETLFAAIVSALSSTPGSRNSREAPPGCPTTSR
jgi:FixJ family two-component response regulator